MAQTNLFVRVTNDYDKFKRLYGNRGVDELRVQRIIKSINKVGYIINPILVNERYEVIDGQGRLEALRRLELPVYYIVVDGIGREECIQMNINQTNWTILDYIGSHAELGNESYTRLLQLIRSYGKTFKMAIILYATTMKIWRNISKLKEGEFECSQEDFEQAQEALSWLTRFVPMFSRLQGHTEYYYMALIFCYTDNEVDKTRLYDKLTALQAGLIPVVTMQQALEQIEDAYNDHSRRKVYIKTNYRKYLDGKYGWYENKYADKYSD